MPNKKGQSGSDDFDSEKEKKAEDKSPKVEHSAVSKKSRENLKTDVVKEELKKDVADEAPKKKRRRRRKKNVAGPQEVKQAEQVSEAKPINPFNDESFEPTAPVVEPAVPAPAAPALPPHPNRSDEPEEPSFVPPAPPVNPFAGHEPADKPLDQINEVEIFDDEPVEAEPEADEQAQESGDGEESFSSDEEVGEKVSEEIIDVEAVEDELPVAAMDLKKAETQEFKREFWDILEQAGISKKTLIVLGIALLVIILGLFVFFMGGGDDGDGVVEEAEVVDEGAQDSVMADVSGTGIYSLVSSYIFGLEYVVPIKPIEVRSVGAFADLSSLGAAFEIGNTGGAVNVRFVGYLELLRKLQNIYQTDVYALMDNSLDRRDVLNLHLVEMDGLIADTLGTIAEIDDEILRLSAEFNQVATDKEAYERAFFSFAQQLYGNEAQQNLDFFIDSSKKVSEIRARHSALGTVREMLINSLNALQPRYKDIQSNTEALVKGVRVFDIPGSNIDAIIRLGE